MLKEEINKLHIKTLDLSNKTNTSSFANIYKDNIVLKAEDIKRIKEACLEPDESQKININKRTLIYKRTIIKLYQ